MSLIDEALKRARQEASRQDAAAREARYARVPTYVPPVRRFALLAAAGDRGGVSDGRCGSWGADLAEPAAGPSPPGPLSRQPSRPPRERGDACRDWCKG